MELHSFFNSSTSYRVRIALALKGLPYDYLPVDIRIGEHRTAEYQAVNAAAHVPTFTEGDFSLGQSLAIIDYLDATHPEPPLMPKEAAARARVLEVALAIACDIHPVNNLRILKYLSSTLKVGPEQRQEWYAHWVAEGLAAVERLLERHGDAQGPYCFGAAPSVADICLVPQVYNAVRNKCDVSGYPRIGRIYGHCLQQPAFQAATPAMQPDHSS